MENGSSNFVVLIALGANLLIAGSKFAAASITGSSSMLSEGIHSLVDTLDQVLLLWGRRLSARPPDENHPFGHGLEFYFWSLIVAILIFAMGGGMSIYEGVSHIRHPEPIRDLKWNFIVIAVALISESISFSAAFKSLWMDRGRRGLWGAFRSSKNPSVFVVIAEDSAALAGLLIAFLGIFLGWRLGMPALDGVGSIVIGALLMGVAGILVYESRALLMGESSGPEVIDEVRRLALSEPGVLEAGRPLTMHFGPDQVLLNMKIKVRPEMTAAELARIIGHFEERVRAAFPGIQRIFVEAAPANPG
jgi:cation diffusion facilitator family transporter